MIERHVTFEVYPEMGVEFIKLFIEEYRPAMAQMPGYVNVELLTEQDNLNSYLMVIRFQSAEDSAAWRNSAEHKTLSPKLKALYKDSKVQVYKVIA